MFYSVLETSASKIMLPDGLTHMAESGVKYMHDADFWSRFLARVSRAIISKPYVSPIACRCCPMSLMMSLSVRDISLMAALGSAGAG